MCDVLVMPVIGTHEPKAVVYSTVYDVMGLPLSLGASHESATLSDVLEVTVRPVGASGGPVDVVVAVASLTYEHMGLSMCMCVCARLCPFRRHLSLPCQIDRCHSDFIRFTCKVHS